MVAARPTGLPVLGTLHDVGVSVDHPVTGTHLAARDRATGVQVGDHLVPPGGQLRVIEVVVRSVVACEIGHGANYGISRVIISTEI
jgi:hypothetical protein